MLYKEWRNGTGFLESGEGECVELGVHSPGLNDDLRKGELHKTNTCPSNENSSSISLLCCSL